MSDVLETLIRRNNLILKGFRDCLSLWTLDEMISSDDMFFLDTSVLLLFPTQCV